MKGPKGEKGRLLGLENRPAGDKGPPGQFGLNGFQGQKGQRGPPGPTGVPGGKGRNGQKGSQGDYGRPGTNGKRGQDGPQGLPGPPGYLPPDELIKWKGFEGFE